MPTPASCRAAARGSGGGAAGVGLRQVLGLHQPLDDLQRAVAPHGGNGPGDGEVLAAEPRAGLDRSLDRVEPFLDGFGFGFECLRPILVVQVGEFVVTGAQPLGLGGLPGRGLAGLRMDAPVARGGAPVGLQPGLGPFPARGELVGDVLELGHGQIVEQRRILEPQPVLVLVREQIPHHRAAGGLVGFDAHEPRQRRGTRHPFLREQALDLPGGGAVVLRGELLPYGELALPVGGGRERLERFQADGLVAVGVEQFGRGVAQTQPLLDDAL